LKFAERTRGTTETRVLDGRCARTHLSVRNALQQRSRFVAPPHHVVEESQLERGFAIRRPSDKRFEQGFGVGVLTAIDCGSRLDHRRIGGALGVRDTARPPVRYRPDG
jgi:hypothetical protein